jgi:hypothetical protein
VIQILVHEALLQKVAQPFRAAIAGLKPCATYCLQTSPAVHL